MLDGDNSIYAEYSLIRGKHSAPNSRIVLVSISPASRSPRAVLCTVSKSVLRFVTLTPPLP